MALTAIRGLTCMGSHTNKLLTFHSKYLLFHPITAFVMGFFVYHLIPPFFSEHGHNWFIIFLDFIGIIFFAMGVVDGIIFKRMFFGTSFKLSAQQKDFHLLFIIFVCLIYPFRIYQYMHEGIYALMHQYALQTVTIFTTMHSLLIAPYILLLWYGVIVLNKKYCYWILSFEFFLQLLILSKSAILYFFLDGMVVYIFFKSLTRRRLKQFSIILVFLLLLTMLIGQMMHDVRSIVFMHQIESIPDLESDFSFTSSENFFIERLDIHSNYNLIEGYEDYIADLDLKGLRSILPKWFGFDKEYEVNPITISYEVGQTIGFLEINAAKTATEFPRSIILFHMGGIAAIVLFSLFWGALFGLMFDVFWSDKNIMFPVFYHTLSFGYLMGGTGALISTTAFQLLFILITFFIPIIIFYVLRFFLCQTGS